MNTIFQRFTEPSSWAGIAAFLAGIMNVPTDSPLVKAGVFMGCAGATLLAFFLREKGKR